MTGELVAGVGKSGHDDQHGFVHPNLYLDAFHGGGLLGVRGRAALGDQVDGHVADVHCIRGIGLEVAAERDVRRDDAVDHRACSQPEVIRLEVGDRHLNCSALSRDAVVAEPDAAVGQT